MNKQELLTDLASKVWCDGLNGIPELAEVKADGGRWYVQNIREVQSESVAVYRNIHFYVVDEGMETEAAYYKDAIPESITKKILTFTEKVNAYAFTHENISVERVNEEGKFAIIKKYIETEIDASEKRFFIKVVDGTIKAKEII